MTRHSFFRIPIRIASIATALVVLISVQAHATFLFGADAMNDSLFSIDSSSLGAQDLGGFNGPVITGLAYDGASNILYGVSPSHNAIFTIDSQTGSAALLVSATTGSNFNGLAFDPNSLALYLTDNLSNGLFRYDIGAAQLISIGTIGGGFSSVEGLAFDPASNTLFGLADDQDQIVRISTATAQATGLPNGLGSGIWRGLGFDSANGVLWATRVNAGGPLTQIDPVTGIGSDVGTLTGLGNLEFIQGLAVVPEPSFLLLIVLGLTAGLSPRRLHRREVR